MPKLKLDAFEVDESNKFALALLDAVVKLEKGYSPLLIHGEGGSGKTHLLSALAKELSLAHPEISLLYIPDDFPIERLALGNGNGSNGGSDEFIYEAYSRKDFLIIDDIERFDSDPKVRDRFYSLFDAFIDNAKQVVLTSSLPIEELKSFSDRFLSRLRGGIDARLSPPQPEGRLRILKRECERLGLNLNVDLLQLMMKEAGGNIQYLKKLPGHLNTFATLNGQELTKKNVKEFLTVIRAGSEQDKATATPEKVYGSWIQAQAKKREDELAERILELERLVSAQEEKTKELGDELEIARSQHETVTKKDSKLASRIKELKKESKEKDEALRSRQVAANNRIGELTKEIEKHAKLVEELNGGHEKELSQRDSRLAELRDALGRAEEELAIGKDRGRETQAAADQFRAEIERLKQAGRDEVLSLKIQLEDKDENLKLLREEREMRAEQHAKEKAEIQEHAAELQNQSLLQERIAEDLNDRISELEQRLQRKSAELSDAVELRNSGEQRHEALTKQL